MNSGGYVLYYEGQPNQGLPNYLFSQDGVGRLTLLITYKIADNVLQNYLNTVVIDESIDTENEVLYASPAAQTVSDFKLSPDESLANVAARYPCNGVAARYSVQQRAGETVVGKHLRIPPEAIWRVQPGDTLASVAERFSVTVITLAHANKNVPGSIEESIQFDDRLEEAIATIPPGNVAYNFWRPAGDPDIPVIDAQAQLDELYNLLGYRIKEVNGFEATNSALPISPVTPEKSSKWVYDSVAPASRFLPDTGCKREHT